MYRFNKNAISKLIFAVLLFISLDCFSQSARTNNQAKAISSRPIIDTARVNLLNELAAQTYNTNPKKALQLLLESEVIADSLNYKEGKIYCYLLLGKIYGKNKEYEKAISYASEGSSLANKYNLTAYKKPLFMLLSELHYDKNETQNDTALVEEVRNIKAAIKYKYFLKDSLDKTKKHAGYLKKEVEVKKNELKLSRFEKYFWMAGSVALIILSGFVFTLLNARKIKIENKQLLTEQKLLRSQMNPHFIFNSTQNIRNLISNKKNEEAIDYLNKFSRLTRQILEGSNENYTSLTEELELIDNYVVLQQLLYNQSFSYDVSIDDAINTDAVFIPPMLTQPFIENAIKHGMASKTDNGQISIRFYLKRKRLYFEVADNGSGFVAGNKKSNHKSLAMSITKERLAHYGKHRNVHFQVHNILDTGRNIVGAMVTFEIPYIYED